MNTKSIRSLFFDLDGTLLDTAPDLSFALNKVLMQHHRSPIPLEVIRPTIAKGTRGLVHHGFAIDEQHPQYETLKQELLTTYQENLTNQTQFFKDMEIVLNYLDENNFMWGIVTNKPNWLAQPLLEHFKLTHRYCCLVAGDTLTKRKPDPAPLRYACQLTGVKPQDALYIGDSEGDVIAAKAAGMSVIIAKYGYIHPQQHPEQWHADGIIESPLQLLDLLS